MQQVTILNLLQYFIRNGFHLVLPSTIKTTFFKDRIIGGNLTHDVLKVYDIFVDLQKFYYILNELTKRGGRILNYIPVKHFPKSINIDAIFSKHLHFFFFQTLVDDGFFTNYATHSKLDTFRIINILSKVEDKFKFKNIFLKYILFLDKEQIRNNSKIIWNSVDFLIVWGLHDLVLDIKRIKCKNVVCMCLTDSQMYDNIMLLCEYVSLGGLWSKEKLEFYLILFSNFFQIFEINKLNFLCSKFKKVNLKVNKECSNINLKKTLNNKKKILLMLWLQNNIKEKTNMYLFNLYYFIWVKFVLSKSYAKI